MQLLEAVLGDHDPCYGPIVVDETLHVHRDDRTADALAEAAPDLGAVGVAERVGMTVQPPPGAEVLYEPIVIALHDRAQDTRTYPVTKRVRLLLSRLSVGSSQVPLITVAGCALLSGTAEDGIINQQAGWSLLSAVRVMCAGANAVQIERRN